MTAQNTRTHKELEIDELIKNAIDMYAEYLSFEEIRQLLVTELVIRGYDIDQAYEIMDIYDHERR